MRRGEVELRTERHDAGRVHLALTPVIVVFDLIEAHRLGNAGHLVEVAQVVRQVRILVYVPPVAFEVRIVDGVEADQRHEEAPVGLGNLRSGEIAALSEELLHVVERVEQVAEGLLVGGLRGGEAGPIDAVVHVRIDQVVDAVDLGAQRLRVEVGAHIGVRVERGV